MLDLLSSIALIFEAQGAPQTWALERLPTFKAGSGGMASPVFADTT